MAQLGIRESLTILARHVKKRHNKPMGLFYFGLISFFLTLSTAFGSASLSNDYEFFERVDPFFEKNVDYSKFYGRTTDRDSTGNVVKVQSESENTKLFRAGDKVTFTIPTNPRDEPCEGYVRDVEDKFFVMYVKDFSPCWGRADYFRRGTQLNFVSVALAKRVQDAAVYRIILMKRKRDFLRQLNEINHFLWSYDQQKVLEAAKYDRKIAELEKVKQQTLENLASKKKDQIYLQKELVYRLDELDKDIGFFRVEKTQLLHDRWDLDHHIGHPVGQRPQKMKSKIRDYPRAPPKLKHKVPERLY